MPHKEHHEIYGEKVPSVNEVTELLPKPWLLGWYKRVGFKAAEAIRDEAADRGLMVHKVFENYLLNVDDPVPSKAQPFLDRFNEWVVHEGANFHLLAAESHLESRQYKYHGSPDLIGLYPDRDGLQRVTVFDFKIKKKYPDYRTILNEAAYAQMWHETKDQPVHNIVILRFDPDTGLMLEPLRFENRPEYFRDFLKLRQAYDVLKPEMEWNKEAKKQDKKGI